MTDKHIKTQAAGRSSVSLPLWLLQSVFHVMLLNHLSARCLQQSTRVKHKLSHPSLPPPLCLTPLCLPLSASLHCSLSDPFFFYIFTTIYQRHMQTQKQPGLYLCLTTAAHYCPLWPLQENRLCMSFLLFIFFLLTHLQLRIPHQLLQCTCAFLKCALNTFLPF